VTPLSTVPTSTRRPFLACESVTKPESTILFSNIGPRMSPRRGTYVFPPPFRGGTRFFSPPLGDTLRKVPTARISVLPRRRIRSLLGLGVQTVTRTVRIRYPTVWQCLLCIYRCFLFLLNLSMPSSAVALCRWFTIHLIHPVPPRTKVVVLRHQ